MSARCLGVAALAVLAISSRASADEPAYVPPDFMMATPPLPVGVDPQSAWRLDLAEALKTAIHQNLGVVIERESVAISRLSIETASGIFEPLLQASYAHSSADQPPVTLQAGAANQILTTTDDNWQLTLTQRLATGMVLSVQFANDRLDSALGTAVEPLNYRTGVTVSATQPLLRGFSTDLVIPRIDVLRAKIASARERDQLVAVAVDVVERTEDAYWDVVQALYTYDLQLRSQKRAEDQLKLTHRQIDAGLTPPSDLISAESTLASRKLQLVQAEGTVERNWDVLRSVLNLPREQWSRPILPIDTPRFMATEPSAERALQTALEHRPELSRADRDLETSILAMRQADNNKLPQIDLGLSGSAVGQDAGYNPALRQLGRVDAPSWSVSLNLTWTPLRRATAAQAEIEKRHHTVAQVNRDQLVQTIWFGVRDAVRNQDNAAKQVSAAAKFRELATENLDVEERKFMSGTSSNFVVAQRQEELAGAQLAELSAVLGHKKATAALLRAEGRLLDERGIELELKK